MKNHLFELLVKNVTENYTLEWLDDVIHVDASNEPIIVSLPDCTARPYTKQYSIKRVNFGDTHVLIIPVVPGQLLEGETQQTLWLQHDTLTVYATDDGWWVR